MPDFFESGDPHGSRKHAIVGVLLGFLGPMFLLAPLGPLGAVLATLLGANAIFVAKEMYDMRKPNATGFSWSDIVAGNAGLLPAVGVVAVAVSV